MRPFTVRRRAMLTLSALVLGAGILGGTPVDAATITTTNTESIASSEPFPATSGTHYHSALGQPVEVGSYFTFEEVRGIAEFDLAGQAASASTTLSFVVNELGSSYYGQSGPGNYTIDVYAYTGDNAIAFGDFEAATFSLLGSFNTSALSVGQTLVFDASAAYTALLGGSLGIRLQPSTDPGDHVANQFSTFTLTTDADVAPIPEPASLTLLGLGLAGMAGRRWRQRKAS